MSPSIFALFVLIPSLFASGTRMITVFMVCCVFGATAAIEMTALGGAPITLAVFALPFLIWWAIKAGGLNGLLQQVRYPSAGAWLLCLSIWGAFSAYLLPRYFAGDTYVFSTSRSGDSLGVSLVLLAPGSTNITQTCYLFGGLAAFAAMRSMLNHGGSLQRFGDAVILLTIINVIAALLGLVEAYTGIPTGLPLLRNANYATFTQVVEVAGLIRIQGTFPEASSFAGFTAPLFAFMASLWHSGHRKQVTGPLALVCLILLLLSTSSSAYGALVFYGSLILAIAIVRSLASSSEIKFGVLSVIAWLAVVVLCLVILLKHELIDVILDFFEVVLWKKLESSSGVERSSWNNQSWIVFLETYGIGAGLGSARASSFPLVLLSNLGVAGVILFLGFVSTALSASFFSPVSKCDPIAKAAAHAALMVLISASMAGTVFDLGMMFYGFSAAATAALVQRDGNSARDPLFLKGKTHSV